MLSTAMALEASLVRTSDARIPVVTSKGTVTAGVSPTVDAWIV